MRKLLFTLAVLAALAVPALAFAGSPHFIGNAFEVTISGDTITVSGKEAGLGDEDQVHIVLSATAQCVNPGGNKPQAANKTSVAAEGDFPVQNGRAEFVLTATAVFQPSCSPPMSVVFSDIVVTDETSGISQSL